MEGPDSGRVRDAEEAEAGLPDLDPELVAEISADLLRLDGVDARKETNKQQGEVLAHRRAGYVAASFQCVIERIV